MEVLKIFKKITKIPHCSGKTQKLREFIAQYAKEQGFNVKVDKAGNILAFSETPLLCLQSHIDMVCVGRAPEIEIKSDNEWMWAENSSLGADDGIGMAIMLSLMKKYKNIEYLFTNDEEIGLIGAKNLELDIHSRYLLNLDSEDDRYIIIGCAGGVDAMIEYPLKKEKISGSEGKVSIENLPGGHSGVDIDKNIPNAIIELIKKVKNISFLKGGERRNSIPSNAYALEIFEGDKEFEVYSKDYIQFLKKLPHGVLEYDFEFKIPSKSVNLALIEDNNIVLSARANSNEKLKELKEYILKKAYGCKVKFEDEYPAWKPEINKFGELLLEITDTKAAVIHAGLECAVLKEKFPEISMVSYGPLIENPHSTRERVNLKSVEKVIKNVEKFIKKFESAILNF